MNDTRNTYMCDVKILKLCPLYVMVDKEIETYIVMAKHDSLWITSGPRLCISREVEVEGESKVEKEKRREGRRISGEGKNGRGEYRGKGRREERKRDRRIKREGKEKREGCQHKLCRCKLQ